MKKLSRKEIIRAYILAKKLHQLGMGQRKIFKKLNRLHKLNISESTISGWIHKENIPFANEKTQFKPKPKPPRSIIYKLYIKEGKSASFIAQKFQVATFTVINWLKNYRIKTRTHKNSMRTKYVHTALREKRLIYPQGEYLKLTKEKAYILGVLCGDAHLNKKRIRLEVKDKDFAEEFVRCLIYVFGVPFRCKYYKPKETYICDTTVELICQDLLTYGNYSTFIWKVPSKILNSKEDFIISSFLKGFFDSEGCAQKYSVTASSANKKGLEGIKQSLKKIGIKSQIHKTKHYFCLAITHKINLRKYTKLIGFTIVRKQEKLRRYL